MNLSTIIPSTSILYYMYSDYIVPSTSILYYMYSDYDDYTIHKYIILHVQ